MKKFKDFTLPNKLTILRLIIALVIIVLAVLDVFIVKVGGIKIGENLFYSWFVVAMFVLFLIATLTDYLDGKIARKTNQVTSFGKFIDPVADKVVHNVLFIYFAINHYILFFVPLIFIFRDTLIDGIRMLAASKNKILAATISGKIKTVLQFIFILILFALSPLIGTSIAVNILVYIFIGLTVLASIISGIVYIVKNRETIFEDA